MIRLENLTKLYGSFVAVDDISLEVKGASCSACSDPTGPARPPRCA